MVRFGLQRPSLPFAAMLVGSILFSCSSSKKGSVNGKGYLAGYVEQVLHHGAYNPDGPNKTISLLAGSSIVLSDTTGTPLDTLISIADGTFTAELTPGVYVLTPAKQQENEFTPTNSPAPKRIAITPNDTTTVRFQYNIYAP